MTLGASTKSNPSANKIDETELERLRKQDYWLVVTRNKLLLDLVFVCKFFGPNVSVWLVSLPCIAFDCFNVKRGKTTVQSLAGLTAACLRFVEIPYRSFRGSARANDLQCEEAVCESKCYARKNQVLIGYRHRRSPAVMICRSSNTQFCPLCLEFAPRWLLYWSYYYRVLATSCISWV